MARKLALGGSEALGGTGCGSEAALAVALALLALALGGGCSEAEPRAIIGCYGSFVFSTVKRAWKEGDFGCYCGWRQET